MTFFSEAFLYYNNTIKLVTTIKNKSLAWLKFGESVQNSARWHKAWQILSVNIIRFWMNKVWQNRQIIKL